jgi:hypothetical protein
LPQFIGERAMKGRWFHEQQDSPWAASGKGTSDEWERRTCGLPSGGTM